MNEDKKKQAYDKAVQDTVDSLYEFHRQNMNNADDPTAYIKNEIEYLDQKLNENLNVLYMIRTGTRDFSGFTESICDEILSTEEPRQWPIVWNEIKDGKVTARKENQFFGLTVDLKLKERFEALLKTIQTKVSIEVPKLQKMVNMANELLANEYENYKPLKSGAFISNDLKDALANEFNMGSATVNDWLKPHCYKEEEFFRIKPEIIASLKSE